MSTYTYNGGDYGDDISTYDLEEDHPGYDGYIIYGNGGDDSLSASIFGQNNRSDALYGGDGDDFLSGYLASSVDTGMIFASGGWGTDRFYATGSRISSDPTFTRIGNATKFRLNDGKQLDVTVSDDVEYISFNGASNQETYHYLTEDLARGIVRRVEWDELYDRVYDGNADWYLKSLSANNTTTNTSTTGTTQGLYVSGGLGATRLNGSAANDTYSFSIPKEFGPRKRDIITNFSPAEGDVLQLHRAAFPGISSTQIKTVYTIKEFDKALSSKSELIYSQRLGTLTYNANGTKPGAGNGGSFVVLENEPSIYASDIQIV